MKNNRIRILMSAVVLSLSMAPLMAQKTERPNVGVIESGYAFTGTGDISGYVLAAEYGYYILPKLKLAGIMEGMSFFDNDVSLAQYASLLSGGVHAYYDVLTIRPVKLQVGLGARYRHWDIAYSTDQWTEFNDGKGIRLQPSSHGGYSRNTIGHALSVGALFELTKTFGFSFRGLYQNDREGRNTVSWRVGAAFKF